MVVIGNLIASNTHTHKKKKNVKSGNRCRWELFEIKSNGKSEVAIVPVVFELLQCNHFLHFCRSLPFVLRVFYFRRVSFSSDCNWAYIAFHKSIIPEATVQSIPKLFEMKLEICGNLCNRECILFRFEFFTLIFVVEAINNNNKLTDWLMETKFGAGVVVLDVFQLLPSIHLHVIIFFSLLCCVFNYGFRWFSLL